MTRPSARYQRHIAAAVELVRPVEPASPATQPHYTEPLDQLLATAKRRGLAVKWRRTRTSDGRGGGFWEVWCDGQPLFGDWTPAMVLERLMRKP